MVRSRLGRLALLGIGLVGLSFFVLQLQAADSGDMLDQLGEMLKSVTDAQKGKAVSPADPVRANSKEERKKKGRDFFRGIPIDEMARQQKERAKDSSSSSSSGSEASGLADLKVLAETLETLTNGGKENGASPSSGGNNPSDEIVEKATEAFSKTVEGMVDAVTPKSEGVIKLHRSRYEPLGDYSEGLRRVVARGEHGSRWGFIDKDKKLVIPLRFAAAGEFNNGLARARIGDKWGYINKTGNFAIAPRFQDADDFSGGLAEVEEKGTRFRIDTSGKRVSLALPQPAKKTETEAVPQVSNQLKVLE